MLGPDRIRFNALLAGIVAGERQQRVLTAKAAARGISFGEKKQLAFTHTPIRACVSAEQLADHVLFAASPRGASISGQVLSVGGETNLPG